MVHDLYGEVWKEVSFNFEFANDSRIQVSNLGRVRSFNKASNGNLIQGSMTNGYRILRLKFFKARDSQTEARFKLLQEQVTAFQKQVKALKLQGDTLKAEEASLMLTSVKKNLSKEFKNDLKKRTINYQSLVHRLVAEAFCNKPSAEHVLVAHLDHDKLNNRFTNLKWMTTNENYAHQQLSPIVIAEKMERLTRRKEDSGSTKLTVTKVMLLKKLLNQGKPIPSLAKQFKVTATQILRIKKGENWSEVSAAS